MEETTLRAIYEIQIALRQIAGVQTFHTVLLGLIVGYVIWRAFWGDE